MSKKPKDQGKSVAYADGWVDKLREQLPEAVATWGETAIHHSRVATRRLSAALDVLEPVLSPAHRKSFAKLLKKLRHQLGPLRDLDVTLGHLDDLRLPRHQAGVEWLRAQLEGQRDEARRRVGKKLDPTDALTKLGAWWGVRHEWVDAGTRVDELMTASLHLQLDAFVEHADGVTGRVVEASDSSQRDPHQLRIAGKALRYTLEMAVESGHPLPASVTAAFKRMQDALGLWHDLVVLAERAMQFSVDTELALHDPLAQLAVLDVAREAVQRSARQLAAFKSLWDKRGAQLALTIRRAFPLTAPQTDLDPPGSPESSPSDPPPSASDDPAAA